MHGEGDHLLCLYERVTVIIDVQHPGGRQRLVEYLQQHPSTGLIDPFEAVEALMARDSMLQPLAEPVVLNQPGHHRLSSGTAELDTFSCAAPVQAVLQAGTA